ncbi:hypothetical protein M422DRAFT_258944 [Sphaerobolus stellatus SS14]|uniref:Secreted protein n=1 Tax=Sphaerobolus stellatus (strain SS14) TaxID=990650 RepID=A0A0C9VL69_SPHS4|nr:hypothetical protein M422DRAFT_258944 [Sphaerobolus stellatus SS14]
MRSLRNLLFVLIHSSRIITAFSQQHVSSNKALTILTSSNASNLSQTSTAKHTGRRSVLSGRYLRHSASADLANWLEAAMGGAFERDLARANSYSKTISIIEIRTSVDWTATRRRIDEHRSASYPILPYPPHFIPIPNSITATHIFDDNLHASGRPSDWRRISSTIIFKLSVMRRQATPIDLAAPRGENR